MKSEPFIFLELLDDEINNLILGLRKEFDGKKNNTNIHITVRGPYSDEIDSGAIKEFERALGGEPILIHSAGIFYNNDFVVFLKVESKNLRKVWWKPDYPATRYGFHPHITVYKGSNERLARSAFNFLKKERLELLCWKYRLTTYYTKQSLLFPEEHIKKTNLFLGLQNKGIVRPDILQRAHNLVRDLKRDGEG